MDSLTKDSDGSKRREEMVKIFYELRNILRVHIEKIPKLDKPEHNNLVTYALRLIEYYALIDQRNYAQQIPENSNSLHFWKTNTNVRHLRKLCATTLLNMESILAAFEAKMNHLGTTPILEYVERINMENDARIEAFQRAVATNLFVYWFDTMRQFQMSELWQNMQTDFKSINLALDILNGQSMRMNAEFLQVVSEIWGETNADYRKAASGTPITLLEKQTDKDASPLNVKPPGTSAPPDTTPKADES